MVSVDNVSRSSASPRIAVIVPVLRDTPALALLLADLQAQSRRPDRIVVVSGAHDERLVGFANEHGLTLIESTASRGVQLDAGARATDTDVLWFIHADARLPSNACEAVISAIAKGAHGGCLRFAFAERTGFLQRLIAWLVRLRIACGGMAYGDQALFCTRTAYMDAGGFPPWPLFEETRLIRYLQANKAFVALPTPVYVATRRWERDGWLRRSLHNRWLALRHMLGAPAHRLAADYHEHSGEAPAPGSAARPRQTPG